MKFSLAWLQEYSKEKLPELSLLEDSITRNAFEIEEVTTHEDDTVLDIKVLPNRAHDALGHRGMARDITALSGTTFVDPHEYYHGEGDTHVSAPKIEIADTGACTRFMSVRIDGITVTESPVWLKKRLQAIGQKSINSIVDITNYVQFSLNKPMHAYDATLVKGETLVARYARIGETLTTLDDKELMLDATTLVIADTEKPLGLAGIKGGKFSGISQATTSVILESANFNPTLIRKTAQKYAIRTDASKRFENEISDTLVEEGLRMTIALIKQVNPDAHISAIVDVATKKPFTYQVAVSLHDINSRLGTSYTRDDVSDVFTRLGFSYTYTTLKEQIEKRMQEVANATYKNPSSMRVDAPEAFSCSSLMSYLFLGVYQPSISIDKYVYGEKVTEPHFGDLVFSNTGEGKIRTATVDFLTGTPVEQGIDHVGMCLGDGKVFHISKKSGTPTTEDIATSPAFAGEVLYARMADVAESYFFVTVPHERLDIRIREDLIEEVVRVRGLASVPSVLPDLARTGIPHKRLYYENIVKNIFHERGFSEIMTYSFGDTGTVEIVKGLASDKTKLRSALASGVEKAWHMNMTNAPLLNMSTVKMYEFGNVFTDTDERRHIAFVLDDGKKKSSYKEEAEEIIEAIKTACGVGGVSYVVAQTKPYIVEFDFDALIEQLPVPAKYVPLTGGDTQGAYAPVSPYPHIVRDIAVWVPEGVTWEDIYALARTVVSPLVVRIDCFDTFSKEIDGVKKTSYAFRFVLQSHERTLTDKEANDIADAMYNLLKEKGYEIR